MESNFVPRFNSHLVSRKGSRHDDTYYHEPELEVLKTQYSSLSTDMDKKEFVTEAVAKVKARRAVSICNISAKSPIHSFVHCQARGRYAGVELGGEPQPNCGVVRFEETAVRSVSLELALHKTFGSCERFRVKNHLREEGWGDELDDHHISGVEYNLSRQKVVRKAQKLTAHGAHRLHISLLTYVDLLENGRLGEHS